MDAQKDTISGTCPVRNTWKMWITIYHDLILMYQ